MKEKNEQFSMDFLRKLSACQTVEELRSAAAAEGQELTQQEAASLLEKLQMQSRELSDEEMAAVAGGSCADSEASSRAKDIHLLDILII